MIKCIGHGAYWHNGKLITDEGEVERLRSQGLSLSSEDGTCRTIAYSILKSHNTSSDMEDLRLKFDAIASHDITYVGIIQTARASGLEAFPLPYVLTNCHNSLCAVGGTINEDDHLFGLSAARRYGGIFVPAHEAVIHAYMRENFAGCGKMILGSDSHTRYGALGTMACGEGGGELVKQLLGRTYDIKRPAVVAVNLIGSPRPGIGPHDVAIALVGAVFASGFVKNKVLEFVGSGIASLNQEFRNAIDVMTTETTCLSSVWQTDEETASYLSMHGREGDYERLEPGEGAYYDSAVEIDLGAIESMIAMPFHPSNAYTIHELLDNADEIIDVTEQRAVEQLGIEKGSLGLSRLLRDGHLTATQGFIGGCAGGTYDSIVEAAGILGGASTGDGPFALSVYPASQPAWIELAKNGTLAKLASAGVIVRTAFCGPCFGAGDVPSNMGFSLRHATRNFPNREGARPAEGQISCVALMDARSIAATAANGGKITAATDVTRAFDKPAYHYDPTVYENRVYNGFGKPIPEEPLVIGPNITDWPVMGELPQNLMLRVCSVIYDDVTTTDELIPSGETSSYRSNPLRLAEFTLSRRDPGYVDRAKAVKLEEDALLAGDDWAPAGWVASAARALEGEGCPLPAPANPKTLGIGSVIYANKPGDGSAREQAASCQKVLGGWANIAREYATKRYRSNLINWGMIPFTIELRVDEADLALSVESQRMPFETGDVLYLPQAREALASKAATIDALVIHMQGDATGACEHITLTMPELTSDERQIVLDGCLINHYKAQAKRS